MKKKELFTLHAALRAVANLKGVKFAYGVARNTRRVKAEIEILEEARKPSETFLVWDRERLALCKEHAQKDDNGKPMSEGLRFVLANEVEFETAMESLQAEHQDAIDGRVAQMKEWEELVDTETDVELHHVAMSEVPEDITGGQLEGILDMIDE